MYPNALQAGFLELWGVEVNCQHTGQRLGSTAFHAAPTAARDEPAGQGSEGWLGTKFSCLNKSSVAQEMRKEAAVAGETVSALYKGVKKRPGTQF